MPLSQSSINTLESRYWEELDDEESAREERLMDILPGLSSLTREQVELVMDWKMARQSGRPSITKNDLQAVSDATIDNVTTAAIAADHLRTQIDALRALPGVGVGVATSILGFVFPDTHVVTDYIVYNGVFDTDKDTISAAQADDLVRHLRDTYSDPPYTLREIDRALFVAHGGFDD